MKTQLEDLQRFYNFELFRELHKPSTLYMKQRETSQPHPLHATVNVLRLLSQIPLTRNKSGYYSFNTFSWWTLYCVATKGLQIAMIIKVIIDVFLKKEMWVTFDITVASLMNVCLLITVFHPIILTWKNSYRIAEALNGWQHLQDSFRAVTANQVSSWLLDHPYLGVLLPTSYLILIEFLPLMVYYYFYSDHRKQLNILTFIVFFFATYYVKLVLWFWLIFTHSISQAAKTLKLSLAETMDRDPSVQRLRLHRFLWMELHNYTCAMTAAVGGTVRAWLTTIMFSFYLSVYATALSFATNTDKTSTMIPLMARGLQAFLLNNASYLAEYQINHDFIVKILNFNYSNFTEDQLEEIELFLYSIENSPERFSLEHMVEPSRETILDILQLAMTIMVILLQFRESA